ncbi:MAG: sigma-70 family RNA polymerase sigma factor [Actinomycetes bacterium]
MTTPEVAAAVEAAHRSDWARVLAATARSTGGDLGIAEEATADAFVKALESWPEHGVPARPGAWLTTTARRQALDLLRRRATLQRRLPLLTAQLKVDSRRDLVGGPLDGPVESEDPDVLPDDRLRLVFTCCHPALSQEAQVALTLRLVAGLTTEEIARSFLVSTSTMAARLTRAKHKITAARIPYRVPGRDDLPQRLDAVLTVIHLVFTAGHSAADSSTLLRRDLTAAALDLARVLTVLLPDESEVLAVLSLLELTEARAPSRISDDGALVLLADQDRTLWDAALVEHGLAMFDRALVASPPTPGRFLLQAGIAAAHAEAPTFEATDWPAIAALYDRLAAVWPSPVVEVNRAVAYSYASGPEVGLAMLSHLEDDPRLRGYHYLPAARAELQRQADQPQDAADSYRQALSEVQAPAERAFLLRRLADLTKPVDGE